MIDTHKVLNRISKEKMNQYNLSASDILYYVENVSYVDDGMFRFLFGRNTIESNNLLRSFIELLLDVHVKSIVVDNSMMSRQAKNQKGVCFDILTKIVLDSGEVKIVNVEMQNYGALDVISRRAQSYVSLLVSGQLKKGDREYRLDNVYHIMLLSKKKMDGFTYDHDYVYCNEYGDVLIENKSNIRFIEFAKLRNRQIKDMTDLEKVCYFMQFAHLENMSDIMKVLVKENEVIRMLEKGKEEYMQDLGERLYEIKEYYDELTLKTMFDDEKREARIEGRKEGLEEGRAEGRAEGRLEGSIEGKVEKCREMVLEMLKENVSYDFIVKVSKLSLEEVQLLAESLS